MPGGNDDMGQVRPIAPQIRAIKVPTPLRDLPLWLVWRYETYAGEPKPRKVPLYASGMRRHGQQGTPYDRAHLVTFAMAREEAAKRGMDGIGLAMLPGADIVALDFDHCVKDGVVDDTVLELVQSTYAEYSPSGTGVRAFFIGKPDVLGNRKARTKDGLFGVEAFSTTGFVTVTGAMLDHVDLLGHEDRIAPLPDSVVSYCHERFGPVRNPLSADDFTLGREQPLGLSVGEIEEMLSYIDPDCDRDVWIRVGIAIHHETEGDDTGLAIWDEWSSHGGKYPGYEGVEYQWRSFRGPIPGRPSITMASVIKLAKEGGYGRPSIATAEELAAAVADRPASGVTTGSSSPDFDGKYRFIHATHAIERPPVEWFIKGVVPKADLGIIFGASGSGKTFVALDMALAMARGVAWRGNRVGRKVRVAYIAAEGGGGLGNRIKANCKHNGLDLRDVDLSIMYATPNFMDKEDISEVLRAMNDAGPFDIVFVDTFAQVTPGANENSGEDMGHALANVRALRLASGAMVVLVHHAGKDASKGSRGWSGLKAAADFQLEVLRHENGVREIHIEKLKDGEDGKRFGFELKTVEMGFDDDGDPITSCVVVESEIKAPVVEEGRKGLKRRGRIETHVLEVIATLGEVSSMKLIELVDIAADMLPAPEPGKRDTRPQAVTRAIRSMAKEKDGPLQLEGNVVTFFE